MTDYQRGEIVLVPFDFTDRSGAKWRPAVLVSSDRYNHESPDVIIASITGNLRAVPHSGDHAILNWQTAGLLIPSLAQAKLATIEGSLLGRRLGTMAAQDLDSFSQGLREALDLG